LNSNSTKTKKITEEIYGNKSDYFGVKAVKDIVAFYVSTASYNITACVISVFER